MALPNSIQNLIGHFNQLPGIGRKTAERLVFFLLTQSKADLAAFAKDLANLSDKAMLCQTCFNYAESNPCEICKDPRRDQTTIAVVAKPQDIAVLESTNEYKGLYHVLGGALNNLEGRLPENLKINELLNRLKTKPIKEIILALNPDLEGETTMLYLAKVIPTDKVKTTRLARGLPMGSDIEYADQTTLSNALKGRRELKNN
ncbi:MAG: recombination mediator RecR [Candidatus Buchananbacteria bacterium]